MKNVKKSTRLQLNRESLRALSAEEMTQAAGASAGLFCNGTFRLSRCICPPITDTEGTLSIPNGGCIGLTVTQLTPKFP